MFPTFSGVLVLLLVEQKSASTSEITSFCSNFSSQWNLYAVCTTQYLLGFHVCAGEDPLIVTHIKQGFREPRVQSLTSFAAECESWVCERELWLAYVCLWRPKNGEDTNKTQLVWTAPSPAGTVGLVWWKDQRWFKNSVVVVGRFQNKWFVLFLPSFCRL